MCFELNFIMRASLKLFTCHTTVDLLKALRQQLRRMPGGGTCGMPKHVVQLKNTFSTCKVGSVN